MKTARGVVKSRGGASKPRQPGKTLKPELHQLAFNGPMLARGFWLYVWEITTDVGKKVYYVGRTGDSSSTNAQSPFARLSQHLGRNRRSNALRRNLECHKLTAEECQSFRLFAFGPVLPESRSMAKHELSRDVVAALEKKLTDAMREAGYFVLNKVQCRKRIDPVLWRSVMAVFTEHLPNLRNPVMRGMP